MRLILVIAFLNFAIPMIGLGLFGWAEGSNLILDPQSICNKKRLRGKLVELCRQDSGIIKEIINGINLGLRECEYQFKDRHWNCTILRRSMKKILMKDTKETSFVSAITSAGITYAVTRACTMGTLIECSCDNKYYYRRKKKPKNMSASNANHLIDGPKKLLNPKIERRNSIEDFGIIRQKNNQSKSPSSNNQQNHNKRYQKQLLRFQNRTQRFKFNQMKRERKLLKSLKLPIGDWEWGGCADNVQFGLRKSKDYLDSRLRKRSDIRTLLKLHNNNAGRLTVRDNMKLECKCHGISGSCTMKTCWFKMPTFRYIGNILKSKYDQSTKVIAGNDGISYLPYQQQEQEQQHNHMKQPTKYDLIYTDESLNFCIQNYKTGSLGTLHRQCNNFSSSNSTLSPTSELHNHNNCQLLCCNRGYTTHLIIENINCQCVFEWCCQVKCQTCQQIREITTCK